jgi:predicted DNA-binding protein YlxM (UPF0122 family)
MVETKKMTVKQYADHRGVKRQTVYKNIRNGQLTKSVVTLGGKMKIIPDLADRELAENLDQIYNRPGSRTQKTDQAARLEIQDKAATVACEGEVPGHIHPWPIWAARYVGSLFLMDPDRLTIERFDKREWRLTVDDLDDETGEGCPWSVDLVFDFNLDQGD